MTLLIGLRFHLWSQIGWRNDCFILLCWWNRAISIVSLQFYHDMQQWCKILWKGHFCWSVTCMESFLDPDMALEENLKVYIIRTLWNETINNIYYILPQSICHRMTGQVIVLLLFILFINTILCCAILFYGDLEPNDTKNSSHSYLFINTYMLWFYF